MKMCLQLPKRGGDGPSILITNKLTQSSPVETCIVTEGGKNPLGLFGEDRPKGSCHLRFSGIRPLRGGGYPPFPLRKKTFFFSH